MNIKRTLFVSGLSLLLASPAAFAQNTQNGAGAQDPNTAGQEQTDEQARQQQQGDGGQTQAPTQGSGQQNQAEQRNQTGQPSGSEQDRAGQEQPEQQEQRQAGQQEEEQDRSQAQRQSQGGASFIAEQSQDETLSSSLIGAPLVASRDGEQQEIGDVSGLIFDQQGRIKGIIVDVGGFLGMGGKSVGIPMTAVQVQNNGEETQFVSTLTSEQLEGAPAYMTLAEKEAEAEKQRQAEQREREAEDRRRASAQDQQNQRSDSGGQATGQSE